MKYSVEDLVQKQALSLQYKIILAKMRLEEWFIEKNGFVYVHRTDKRKDEVLLDIIHKQQLDVIVLNSEPKGLFGIESTLAMDNENQKQRWLEYGSNEICNNGVCRPLSIWTEEDIDKYIEVYL